MDKTLYDLIGVPSHASPDEIESACIALGQRLANDKSTDIKAEYEFAELERAYEVLGNPDKRREYDSTIGIVSSGTGNTDKNWKSWTRWLRLARNPRALAVAGALSRHPRAAIFAGLFILLAVGATFGPQIYARWQLYRMGIPYSPPAFSAAVSNGNHDVVRMLMEAGINPNTTSTTFRDSQYDTIFEGFMRGKSSLMVAVTINDLKMIQTLLKGGANPNYSGDASWTPLEAMFSDSQLRLIREGPVGEEVRAKSRDYLIPAVTELLKHGAIPNLRDGKWLSRHQKLITSEGSVRLTGDERLYLLLEEAANSWRQAFVRVDPDCTVNGLGTATCTFRNRSATSTNICVRLVFEFSNSGTVRAHSSEICSGMVASNDVRQITQLVPFVDSKGNQVTPREGCRLYDTDTSDWRQHCSLEIDVAIGRQ